MSTIVPDIHLPPCQASLSLPPVLFARPQSSRSLLHKYTSVSLSTPVLLNDDDGHDHVVVETRRVALNSSSSEYLEPVKTEAVLFFLHRHQWLNDSVTDTRRKHAPRRFRVDDINTRRFHSSPSFYLQVGRLFLVLWPLNDGGCCRDFTSLPSNTRATCLMSNFLNWTVIDQFVDSN